MTAIILNLEDHESTLLTEILTDWIKTTRETGKFEGLVCGETKIAIIEGVRDTVEKGDNLDPSDLGEIMEYFDNSDIKDWVVDHLEIEGGK